MWLFKSNNVNKHGESPTKEIFGIQFTNGYGFVEKFYDYRFFSMNTDFTDVTPDEFLVKENEIKRVLVRVPGGIGDSLFATPLIDGIKAKYGPQCSIEVIGQPYSLEALVHNPNITRFHSEPVLFFEKMASEFDDVFDLGSTIENNVDAEFENAYKITADTFKITPASFNPIAWITEQEVKHAKNIIADLGVPLNSIRIGVHLESTSPLRSFPRTKMNTLLNSLAEVGHVFAFSTAMSNANRQDFVCGGCGYKDAIVLHENVNKIDFKCEKCDHPNIISPVESHPNVHHVVGTKLRTSMALLNEMDLLVCVDSGLLHLGAALGVPLVALFSNFDGALRTKYFNNCVTINTKFRCAPCHLNNMAACPPMLAAGLKEPPCLQEYSVEDIMKSVRYIVSHGGADFPSMHLNPPPEPKQERSVCILCGGSDYDIVARKKDVLHARCLKCESIFTLSGAPKDAYNIESYHDVFNNEEQNENNVLAAKSFATKLNKLLGTEVGNRIMEIGCNRGDVLRGFSQAGWVPYGVEYSQFAVNKITEPWKKNVLVGDFLELMDAHLKVDWNWPGRASMRLQEATEEVPEQLWIKAGGFELVYLQHTFEHFEKPMEAFAKCVSLVAPNGLLVITGPSASAMSKWGTGKNTHLNTFYPGEHQIIPSKKAMLTLASDFGLDILEFIEDQSTSNMQVIMKKRS